MSWVLLGHSIPDFRRIGRRLLSFDHQLGSLIDHMQFHILALAYHILLMVLLHYHNIRVRQDRDRTDHHLRRWSAHHLIPFRMLDRLRLVHTTLIYTFVRGNRYNKALMLSQILH